MSIELRPLGTQCNLSCLYCYQNPIRDYDSGKKSYDLSNILKKLEDNNQPLCLFGGEPLLVELNDLEVLFDYSHKRFGTSYIQTNATLISSKHLALFQLYNVQVGISIDGPKDLNTARWAGSVAKSHKNDELIDDIIKALCAANATPSLIVTLHKINAAPEKIQIMKDWFVYLDGIGISNVRLHTLQADSEVVADKLALTQEENLKILFELKSFEHTLPNLRFDIFSEMKSLLLGHDDDSSCVWHSCDPWSTQAVTGLEGDGRTTNCSRTNKDGIDFEKSEDRGFERYLELYRTPQANGGCHKCRFFLVCKGQCPGTAINNDWRNKSEHCEIWKRIFSEIEIEIIESGLTPISLRSDLKEIEYCFIINWINGRNPTISDAISK